MELWGMAKGYKKRKVKKYTYKKRKKQLPQWVLVAIGAISVVGILMGFLIDDSLSQESAPLYLEESYSQTNETFIDAIGETARQIAAENDLYASVMIAQAILESDHGQSALSQPPYYNYFGIKGDYFGNSVIFPTLEDDGTGATYSIDAPFRAYSNPTDSLQDYANLLQNPLYLPTHKSQTQNYQEATAALTGTYATDTSYNLKLNELIAFYQLTDFDH